MRKFLLSAGILFAAALVFARTSKADTIEFVLTGSVMPGGASFSLPDTFTPTAGTGSGPFLVANVAGTLLGTSFTYSNIELGLSATGQWAFGNTGVPGFPGTTGDYLGIFVPSLFTVNADGTITLNEGLGTLTLMNINLAPLTLTEIVTPTPPTGTPEPASMVLLGVGGLSLLGLRRRKAV